VHRWNRELENPVVKLIVSDEATIGRNWNLKTPGDVVSGIGKPGKLSPFAANDFEVIVSCIQRDGEGFCHH